MSLREARQEELQGAAVAERDTPLRPAQDEIRGDHRGGRKTNVGRIGQNLLQLSRFDQAVHACGAQRMDGHGRTKLLGGEDGIEV